MGRVAANTVTSENVPNLLAAWRRASGSSGLQFARPLVRIPQGNESEVYALALSGGPPEWSGHFVLRVFRPDALAGTASSQAALQSALVEQSILAPRVPYFDDSCDAIGCSHLLMERMPGEMLIFGALDVEQVLSSPVEFLKRVPALWRTLTRTLPHSTADAQRTLQGVETKKLRRALEKAGHDPDRLRFESRLDDLTDLIGEAAALEELVSGLEWVRAQRPPEPERLCLVHGDLLPNVMISGESLSGIIDWSASSVIVGDPAHDTGVVQGMMLVTLPVPFGFRTLTRWLQQWIFWRYVTRLGGVFEPARVDYYEAFWLLSLLSERSLKVHLPDPDEEPSPWDTPEILAITAKRFSEISGVPTSVPESDL